MKQIFNASVRRHRVRPSLGAQAIDRVHPEADLCQTAKGDGGKPRVSFLTRSKRGTLSVRRFPLPRPQSCEDDKDQAGSSVGLTKAQIGLDAGGRLT